jgi:hypothetical protein
MAGLRGNQALFALAKQTAKGSPNTTYAASYAFTGGSIQPSRSVGNLSETDAQRDQGVSYVENFGIEGTPEVYVREGNVHRLVHAALGATNTTGTTNYVHTATPAAALPYYTLYREIGGTLFEQFDDCMANEITFSADAGAPMTVGLSWLGLQATRLAASAAPPAISNAIPINYNDATVTLAGAGTSLVSSFELTLSNNTTTQQTDAAKFYDVVPGLRECTVGFQLIFETLAEYNRFHYGGISGTAQSATLATVALDFEFILSANNSIKFTIPSAAYEEFPVDPDPAGAPIVVDVRARAQRSGSPLVTIVTKNQVATAE